MSDQPAPASSTGDIWAEIIADLPEGHVLRPLDIQARTIK